MLIFNTTGSNAKDAEMVNILSWLKVTASKSVSILWLKVRLQQDLKESDKSKGQNIWPCLSQITLSFWWFAYKTPYLHLLAEKNEKLTTTS